MMMDLIKRHDLRPERVKRVGGRHQPQHAERADPPSAAHRAAGEVQHGVLHGDPAARAQGGLEQFTDEVVNRPDVQALMQKVDFGVHPEAEAAGFDKMTTIITVELDDGSVVKGAADFGKGSPANPMSDAELSEKFRQCAAWGGLDRERTKTVLDLAWRIEKMKDIGELMKLLRLTGTRGSPIGARSDSLSQRRMIYEQIATGGCQSYLLGCSETCAAVVIDPEISQIDRYLGARRARRAAHPLPDRYAHARRPLFRHAATGAATWTCPS